jgi:hypothetical protein
MFGKKHSESSREKMSINHKGFNHSKETIKKFQLSSSGENNSNSKLTESIVKEIRNDYNKGEITYDELAIKYNVKKPCIWKIINKITWKNI